MNDIIWDAFVEQFGDVLRRPRALSFYTAGWHARHKLDKAENAHLQEEIAGLCWKIDIEEGTVAYWVKKSWESLGEIVLLQEQNAQLVFATELLVKELNALKEVKQEECPEINISP